MPELAITPDCPTRDLPWLVAELEALHELNPSVPVKIRAASALLGQLVAHDGWLDPSLRRPVPDSYARYLLHRDPRNRFVVLSLVWLPGHATPVHDHECWGVMGVLQGALEEADYERLDDGSRPGWAELREVRCVRVAQGATAFVLPPYQEIHRIANATPEPAVSIHVYGRDLDQVSVFDMATRKVSRMRIKYYNEGCGAAEFAI